MLKLKSHFKLNRNMIVTFRWRLHLTSNLISWDQFPFVKISEIQAATELSHILWGNDTSPLRGGGSCTLCRIDGWSTGAICGLMWVMDRVTLHYFTPLSIWLSESDSDQWSLVLNKLVPWLTPSRHASINDSTF